MSSKTPPLPGEIKQALQKHSEPTRKTLLALRKIIFSAASANPDIGPVTETLKWGEPAYLTEATKSGSTIRLGRTRKGGKPAIFVNCKTNLVAQFKQHYADVFEYEGVRALIIDDLASTSEELQHCISLVLTYHKRK